MSFQLDKFQSAEFAARVERVAIPQLVEFFDEGEAPEFVVRGLTASELQRAIEAGQRQNAIDTVVKAIASKKDQVETIRKALGLTYDTPGEIAKRIEMLVLGCTAPVLNHAAAVKLAEVCPVEFYELTNKVVALTGQGGSRVKQQPSSQPTTV
jgi:glutamate racemase